MTTVLPDRRQPGLRRLLLAAVLPVVLLLMSGPGNAAAPVLNIVLTQEDRDFLLSTHQRIAIVLPEPGSASNAGVTVALALRPIADLTQVGFVLDSGLYLAYPPVVAFGTIVPALSSPASDGQAYSFDGAGINAGEGGVDGYVSIRYAAAAGTVPPVVVGTTGMVFDLAVGKPAKGSPLNWYILNRGEAQLIPSTKRLAWVFIATDLTTGSVVPWSQLVPVGAVVQSPRTRRTSAGGLAPQIGRYLAVQLDATEQNTIHFDSSVNAFVYGNGDGAAR